MYIEAKGHGQLRPDHARIAVWTHTRRKMEEAYISDWVDVSPFSREARYNFQYNHTAIVSAPRLYIWVRCVPA